MFMSDISGSLRRRWALSVVGFGLVVGAMSLAMVGTNPAYQSEASMLLLPPPVSPGSITGPDFTKGNPLFYLTAMDQSRDVLIGSLTSKQTQDALGRRFPGATYTVTPDVLGSSAVLALTVKSGSAAETSAMLDGLMRLVPSSLRLVQAQLGVRTDALITSQPLAKDPKPTVSHKPQIRRAIEAGAGVGLLCLFLIAAVDSIVLTRQRKRAARQQQGDVSEESSDPDDRPSDQGPSGTTEAAHPVDVRSLRLARTADADPDSGEGDDPGPRRIVSDRSEDPDAEGDSSSPGNTRPLAKMSRGKRAAGPGVTGRQATSYRGRSR